MPDFTGIDDFLDLVVQQQRPFFFRSPTLMDALATHTAKAAGVLSD